MEPRSSITVLACLCIVMVVFIAMTEFRTGSLKVIMHFSPPKFWLPKQKGTNVSVENLAKKGSMKKIPMDSSRRRLILVYTGLFGMREWYHLPAKDAANFASRCKFSNCEVSYDNSRLKDSDAVIFHARDMPDPNFLRKIHRPDTQRWVYFISENPVNTPDRAALNGLFNWTMTYKKESDIWIPYKRSEELLATDAKPKIIDVAAQKNKVPNRKLAFWIVSHCGRYRDQLVHKLQDYISVDVAGGCAGRFKNPSHDCNKQGRDACVKQTKNYKFYLSLENTFCDQYVTEKYWYNALEHDIVPIVMGGGPYNDPKVAIPGSFINAADFPSVKALADHLKYLDKNDTAYNEYFQWKQKYKLHVDLGWPYPGIFTCDICEKLHVDDTYKVYDRLSDFWSVNDCSGRDTKVVNMVNKG
eukprot:Seg1727.1 transcript_id=Seg1727.1/GoldUCD/mRNA.D3Y31 product="Glycoprotein 3-alpha-L-fucosyltransferase A" protein_id=Seg1727.1/GoldUCD/D3Y31